MAFLFNKFQEAVKVLAKSPTFARDPRQLQFEADINRLFLYTSYNRLGRDAEEADIEEIIELAGKASVVDQQTQIQENIHSQIQNFCTFMNGILLPNPTKSNEPGEAPAQSKTVPRRSGLTYALGKVVQPTNFPAVPETMPLKQREVSQRLKELIGYTLDLKSSQIPHEEAGQGLYVNGEADVGSVIAFYPGVIYTPTYYRYIPGYPRVDAYNSYLITRYDGTVINAQPWGSGGESREVWNALMLPENKPDMEKVDKGSDRIWKMLSKPLDGEQVDCIGDVLERRNPLALAHYANHPAKGMVPNVMICPYDFPLNEKDMRTYIPNVLFGNKEEVKMRRFGSFWFRSGSKNDRLSNTKRRPAWYTPVDEDEDRRRWS